MTPPRLATSQDIEALLELMERFDVHERIKWVPARTRKGLELLLACPTYGFVVVTGQPNIVAHAVVTYNFDLEFGGLDCFLTEIFVTPKARRQGTAMKILEFAQARAKAAGAAAMSLAVRPENSNARHLYAKLGFQDTRRILLSKELD